MVLLLKWHTWLVIALIATHIFVYKKGEESIQVDFDVYKNEQILSALAAETAARAKEQSLNLANKKVTDNYESLKTATATVVKSLDADRMRLQAAISSSDSTTAKDTGTGLQPIESPKDRVLNGCLQRYEEVATDADQLSDQVIALQEYVNKVVKP
jgi:hypothetical protein